MLTATAKPSRVSRERKSAQPLRVGAATRTHRKISSVMSQINIQVILFLYLFLNYFIHYSGPFRRQVS